MDSFLKCGIIVRWGGENGDNVVYSPVSGHSFIPKFTFHEMVDEQSAIVGGEYTFHCSSTLEGVGMIRDQSIVLPVGVFFCEGDFIRYNAVVNRKVRSCNVLLRHYR